MATSTIAAAEVIQSALPPRRKFVWPPGTQDIQNVWEVSHGENSQEHPFFISDDESSDTDEELLAEFDAALQSSTDVVTIRADGAANGAATASGPSAAHILGAISGAPSNSGQEPRNEGILKSDLETRDASSVNETTHPNPRQIPPAPTPAAAPTTPRKQTPFDERADSAQGDRDEERRDNSKGGLEPDSASTEVTQQPANNRVVDLSQNEDPDTGSTDVHVQGQLTEFTGHVEDSQASNAGPLDTADDSDGWIVLSDREGDVSGEDGSDDSDSDFEIPIHGDLPPHASTDPPRAAPLASRQRKPTASAKRKRRATDVDKPASDESDESDLQASDPDSDKQSTASSDLDDGEEPSILPPKRARRERKASAPTQRETLSAEPHNVDGTTTNGAASEDEAAAGEIATQMPADCVPTLAPQASQPLQSDPPADEVYVVDRIIAQCGDHFLVIWKNYPLRMGTWEPRENLTGCPDCLAEFYNSDRKPVERCYRDLAAWFRAHAKEGRRRL